MWRVCLLNCVNWAEVPSELHTVTFNVIIWIEPVAKGRQSQWKCHLGCLCGTLKVFFHRIKHEKSPPRSLFSQQNVITSSRMQFEWKKYDNMPTCPTINCPPNQWAKCLSSRYSAVNSQLLRHPTSAPEHDIILDDSYELTHPMWVWISGQRTVCHFGTWATISYFTETGLPSMLLARRGRTATVLCHVIKFPQKSLSKQITDWWMGSSAGGQQQRNFSP